MTTDEIKYQLALLLEKQGKTLLDFEHDLEVAMEKKAGGKWYDSPKGIVENLKSVGSGLWTTLKGMSALPFGAGVGAGALLGWGGHGLYSAQADSTERLAQLLVQKRQIEEARKEIEAQKIQQGLA